MGGSAFSVLPSSSFPRLPSSVYEALKARLTPALLSLYRHVAVPIPAPEKTDHGDLDFIVCTPIVGDSVNVPHDQVKTAVGALHCILEEGNRTSNFAILVERDSWGSLGCADQEKKGREIAEDKDIFYQVDIHVCADKDEWDRVVYFHSYGDLGMMQGLVARNVGLILGVNGLKFPNPPHPTLTLSQDFTRISEFFGWSIERRAAGFTTRQEVFEWITESRFFDPYFFQTSGDGITKVKASRTMYFDFITWVKTKTKYEPSLVKEEVKQRRERVRNDALEMFGRRKEVETYVREFEARKTLKTVFNGTTVNAWTGLNNNWRAVKIVMDKVREQYGDEEGLLPILLSEGTDGIKRRVTSALQESVLTPQPELES